MLVASQRIPFTQSTKGVVSMSYTPFTYSTPLAVHRSVRHAMARREPHKPSHTECSQSTTRCSRTQDALGRNHLWRVLPVAGLQCLPFVRRKNGSTQSQTKYFDWNLNGHEAHPVALSSRLRRIVSQRVLPAAFHCLSICPTARKRTRSGCCRHDQQSGDPSSGNQRRLVRRHEYKHSKQDQRPTVELFRRRERFTRCSA